MAKKQTATTTRDTYAPTLTLIIPARGREPLLQRTIDHAVHAAGCPIRVLVVDSGLDGPAPIGADIIHIPDTARGTSAARHAGMCATETELAVTIDAHVMLDRCWALNIIQTFESPAWHESVACGHVGHLTPAFTADDEPCYHGARINWLDTSAEPRFLVARWDAKTKPGGKIGAVMGAYYALRTDWYQAMCCPWQVNRAWGCDEEIISISSWLSGGNCRLLPDDCRAWHLFNSSPTISYLGKELAEIHLNRLRMLSLFPFTAAEIAALCDHAQLPLPPAPDSEPLATFADCYAAARPALVEYLTHWVTGYSAWRDRQDHVPVTAAPPTAPSDASAHPSAPAAAELPPVRLAPIPQVVCPQCDARDAFIVTHTYPTFRRYKCKRCGRKAWRLRESGPMNFSVRND